jgi:hypothetical protein
MCLLRTGDNGVQLGRFDPFSNIATAERLAGASELMHETCSQDRLAEPSASGCGTPLA